MLEITFAKRTNTGRWATGLFIYIASPITAFKVDYEQYKIKQNKMGGLQRARFIMIFWSSKWSEKSQKVFGKEATGMPCKDIFNEYYQI